ncbi:hypothetical protein V8F20_007774 [Naviculisporaceae sp. PSN 640]
MRIHTLPFALWLLVTAKIEALESQSQSQAQQQSLPTAIKKMSPDQGEKFFPHYYAFAEQKAVAEAPLTNPIAARRILEDEDDAKRIFINASAELAFRQPFAPHLGGLVFVGDDEDRYRKILPLDSRRNLFHRAAQALAWLERRDWSCPTGTSSCAAIGFPNSCCQDNEVCVEITDTGLGNVGCCPEGATCGGSVSQCSDGNTPCASDIGGGCCIPGFVCEGIGCNTMTTTGAGSDSEPTTVVITVIVTITPSQSPPQTATLTTTQTTTASPITRSDENPIPPIRINTFCPTGFYACKAVAGGGCCQTGRDCQTTSCPPIQMTTIVNSNGITVAVPATDIPAATTGRCAEGWFLCGKEAGPVAGCCPSGYSCGTASCTVLNAQVTGTVAKELPGSGNAATGKKVGSWWWVLGLLPVGVVLGV